MRLSGLLKGDGPETVYDMKDGFVKLACVTPDVRVADVAYNTTQTLSLLRQAAEAGVCLALFPELGLTGYTCGDLFLQDTLPERAADALLQLLNDTATLDMTFVVGLPVLHRGKLYNCAAVCHRGDLLALVPKLHLPNYGEFQEMRFFTPGFLQTEPHCMGSQLCPIGADVHFTCAELPSFSFGVEVCEDLFVADSPSHRLASLGATILLNLSASDEVIGKAVYRRTLLEAKSGSLLCAYAYADAGIGESTTDLVFAGHNLIAENGKLLAESPRFTKGLLTADVDTARLIAERRRNNAFSICEDAQHTEIFFSMSLRTVPLTRSFSPMPFVPLTQSDLDNRCAEIQQIQAVGLMTRLRHIGCSTAVLGLSGGLDSTLALLITVQAFDMLGLDRKGILAVTMPCFGTTDRTYANACRLAETYGVTLREIDIRESVLRHFQDIGQDPDTHDVTYENAQARERTQILMDLANQRGSIVIGTGDLSELALGWATYNGDHMSMYGVNASVPKTLVRHLVAYTASVSDAALRAVLLDVLDTPVSPELLPPEQDGSIAQKTEDLVGPYLLHDFFLYYFLRFGMAPAKIYRIACIAFSGTFAPTEILRWEKVFLRRFFSQQFKRSCLPDGVKIGSVSLSPRGDWRMPSDACASEWLRDLDAIG